MGVRVGNIIDKICGGRSKHCWLKLVALIFAIFFCFGVTWFMLFNFNYDGDKIDINATDPAKLKKGK
jgi:hypothetical protein